MAIEQQRVKPLLGQAYLIDLWFSQPFPSVRAADEASKTMGLFTPCPGLTGLESGSATIVLFEPSCTSEIAAGETTLVATNNGTVPHNFEIENEGIGLERDFEENLQPGETLTMTVHLEPGEYYVYCPIGNHAARGMELNLTVTEQ